MKKRSVVEINRHGEHLEQQHTVSPTAEVPNGASVVMIKGNVWRPTVKFHDRGYKQYREVKAEYVVKTGEQLFAVVNI